MRLTNQPRPSLSYGDCPKQDRRTLEGMPVKETGATANQPVLWRAPLILREACMEALLV
jgi:hypothetical protein